MNARGTAREHLEIGFCDYVRFGIPITILTAGVPGFFCCSYCTENPPSSTRQPHAGEVKALRHAQSIQTIAARERFALAQDEDTQKA